MNSGEYKLTPDEISPYFVAGWPGLKTLISSIPKNYKEIQEKYSYNKALIYTALAFGYGKFNKENGKMEYTLKTELDNMYWIIFSLIQKSPNNKLEGNGYAGKISFLTWRQPKGKFIVKHNDPSHTYYHDSEVTCFSEDTVTSFYIRFSPSELNNEKPAVEFQIDNDDELCRNLFAALPEK